MMLALMWLLLIRPQRRRAADHARMMAALAVGDEVLSSGGILGRVLALGDDAITLEIAPGTNVRLAKDAVAGIVKERVADGESLAEAEAEPPAARSG